MPETDVSDGSTLTQPELWPFSNQQTTLSQMCQKNYPCNGEGTPKMPKGEVYSLVGVSLSTDWSLKPVFVKGMKSVCLCAVFLFLHSPLLFLPFSWAIVQSGGELAASLNLCSPKARHSCKHFAHGFFSPTSRVLSCSRRSFLFAIPSDRAEQGQCFIPRVVKGARASE